jgi:hypothetical protein
MDNKRAASLVFNNKPQESQLRGGPKNRWWNCVEADISNCEIKTGKRGKKTELNGRSPLSGRRTALD